MKVFMMNKKKERDLEGGIHMLHEHRNPGGHILPHERKALINIEFDEADWTLLKEVFGDEDTTTAAAEIIREAPPEIQILAIQLMNVIEEVA